MTKKSIQAVKRTQKMWEWLSKNPQKNKFDYMDTLKIDEKPFFINQCFLCDEWIALCSHGKSSPNFDTPCPLDTRALCCDRNNGNPFGAWSCETDIIKRSNQANRIVNACKRWLKNNT